MRTLLLAGALLAACGLDVDRWEFSSEPGGRGTTVVVHLSDSPVDGAERVWVVFERVTLDGVPLTTRASEHDLLALRNGRTALLAETEVPAGRYRVLRLELALGGHRVDVGGATHPLQLASPEAAQVVVDVPLDLADGERAEIHIDFNVRLSVLEASGNWTLDPRLALLDPEGGYLAGTVAGSADAVVSAQSATGQFFSTRVESDGSFRLGPLPQTEYTLVVTAPGRAPAMADGLLPASENAPGHLFRLDPVAPGSIAGRAPPGVAASAARLYLDHALVALAGIDLAGRFTFPSVAPGSYRVELWDEEGRVVEGTTVVTALGAATVAFS